MAEAVVENLQIKLGVRERQLVRRRWTENTEAYDEFLQGIKSQLLAPTVENIKKTSLDDLEKCIGKSRALKLWKYFN